MPIIYAFALRESNQRNNYKGLLPCTEDGKVKFLVNCSSMSYLNTTQQLNWYLTRSSSHTSELLVETHILAREKQLKDYAAKTPNCPQNFIMPTVSNGSIIRVVNPKFLEGAAKSDTHGFTYALKIDDEWVLNQIYQAVQFEEEMPDYVEVNIEKDKFIFCAALDSTTNGGKYKGKFTERNKRIFFNDEIDEAEGQEFIGAVKGMFKTIPGYEKEEILVSIVDSEGEVQEISDETKREMTKRGVEIESKPGELESIRLSALQIQAGGFEDFVRSYRHSKTQSVQLQPNSNSSGKTEISSATAPAAIASLPSSLPALANASSRSRSQKLEDVSLYAGLQKLGISESKLIALVLQHREERNTTMSHSSFKSNISVNSRQSSSSYASNANSEIYRMFGSARSSNFQNQHPDADRNIGIDSRTIKR